VESANRRRSTAIKSELENEHMDPLLREIIWMRQHIDDCPQLSANPDLVEVILFVGSVSGFNFEHFYGIIMLHLQSYTHYKSPVKSALNYIKELHEMEASFLSCFKIYIQHLRRTIHAVVRLISPTRGV
jgi:hypothetical protein